MKRHKVFTLHKMHSITKQIVQFAKAYLISTEYLIMNFLLKFFCFAEIHNKSGFVKSKLFSYLITKDNKIHYIKKLHVMCPLLSLAFKDACSLHNEQIYEKTNPISNIIDSPLHSYCC